MTPFLHLAVPLLLLSAGCTAQVTNICSENITLGVAVISSLNLSYPGLSAVAAAADKQDYGTACEALATYYADSNTSAWLRRPSPPPSTQRVGGSVDDAVFHDIFDEGDLGKGKVPRNPDGGLDWQCRGPRNDPEYENVLNRFSTLTGALNAWSATGNPEYTSWIDRTVIDWATHNPCPGGDLQATGIPKCYPVGDGRTPACGWGQKDTPGSQACVASYIESPWRLLEDGIRMGDPWPATFFGLQGAAATANFSVSARALMVLVAGEHLASLQAAGAQGVSNWAITQNTGLVTLAVAWPELKGAGGAREAGLAALLSLLHTGVYPDGVETEQASGYGMNTAADFFAVAQLLATAGAPPPPPAYTSAVEAMWTYGAYSLDPSGCLPRNGDTDVCEKGGYSLPVAQYFNRLDWTYIASGGKSGQVPPTNATQGPSAAFPWAGQVVMRSAYDEGALWAWFDVGPQGSSIHGHRDKLGLNVHAHGAMLLVDSGRFAYSGTDLSALLHVRYARNASAHNTFTIGGCDQLPVPPIAASPLPPSAITLTPAYDAAFASMGNFDPVCLGGKGANVSHSRGVHFQRSPSSSSSSPFILVVDVVTSDTPRAVEAHWHTHPNASALDVNSTSGVARVGGARWSGEPLPAQLCLTPAQGGSSGGGGSGWEGGVRVAKGEQPPQDPNYQGWFSASYDDAQPASTLVYTGSVLGGGEGGEGVWGWLIHTSPTPTPSCSGDSARVMGHNGTHVDLVVSVSGGQEETFSVRYQ